MLVDWPSTISTLERVHLLKKKNQAANLCVNCDYDDSMSCSVSPNNSCQTTSSMSQTEEFEYMFSENGYQPPTQDYFNTDEKVRFYTGLPSTEILLTVFHHVSVSITRRNQTLSKFQEFIMVLMKLQLNIPFQELAYHFQVSSTCIKDIFFMVDCNGFSFVATHSLARQSSAMGNNANVFPASIWQNSDCGHSLL